MSEANQPEPKTHLYLIRHAQAIVNVEPTIVGKSGDFGLTELGIQQAERLRDRLAATGEIAADVLIASTYRRASQTAEIITPALGLDIIYDDEVQEFRIGDEVDGMSITEFEAKYPPLDIAREPFRPIAPGAENWPQFMLRVGTALDRISRQHQGKTVVIVTHGGFVDGSFVYFFGLPSMKLPPAWLLTENTSITQWEQDNRRGHERWRLIRYNDDLHVRDIGATQPVDWHLLRPDPVTDEPAAPLPTEPAKVGEE